MITFRKRGWASTLRCNGLPNKPKLSVYAFRLQYAAAIIANLKIFANILLLNGINILSCIIDLAAILYPAIRPRLAKFAGLV